MAALKKPISHPERIKRYTERQKGPSHIKDVERIQPPYYKGSKKNRHNNFKHSIEHHGNYPLRQLKGRGKKVDQVAIPKLLQHVYCNLIIAAPDNLPKY